MKPILWFSLVGGLTYCASAMPPPCTQDDLKRIEAEYQAEFGSKCAGQDPCPFEDEIDEKYRKKREKWVACDAESNPQ